MLNLLQSLLLVWKLNIFILLRTAQPVIELAGIVQKPKMKCVAHEIQCLILYTTSLHPSELLSVLLFRRPGPRTGPAGWHRDVLLCDPLLRLCQEGLIGPAAHMARVVVLWVAGILHEDDPVHLRAGTRLHARASPASAELQVNL